MFGILKKKISNFIGNLTKKEEGKKPKKVPPKKEKPEKKKSTKKKIERPRKRIEKKVEIKEPIKKIEKEKPTKEKIEEIKLDTSKEEIKEETIEKPTEEAPKEITEEHKEQPKKGFFDKIKSVIIKEPKKEILEEKKEEIEIKEIEEPEEELIEEKLDEEPEEIEETKEKPKKEIKVKLGVFDQIKSVVTGEVEIKEEDIQELLEEFELGMLEGDVALEIAEEIKSNLEKRLIGKRIKRGEISKEISKEMEEILLEIMEQKNQVDILEFIESKEKPVKIMFLGINGAGKTTTLAKIAYMLQKKGKKVVFAAADTFRAAAIEQIGVHAEKLGVKLVKRPYGSDSTAVVYDAVNYGKAHGIDAVLIDTAGRQDNNIDLINELKKMERVIKPDLKVYIGESIGGNAVVSQVSSFHKEIGLDGVILTKIDCDPKGGTIISISKSTGLPILYITHGQGYEDIKRFEKEEIIDNLIE